MNEVLKTPFYIQKYMYNILLLLKIDKQHNEFVIQGFKKEYFNM